MAYIYKGKGRAGKRVRRRLPTKKTVVRKARATYANKKIATVVKKVLAKKVETKIRQDAGSLVPRTIQNGMTQTEFDNLCFMCTPQGATIGAISQAYPIIGSGVGQDQRIGDEITVKGHYINYIVNARPYNATTNITPRSNIVQVWVVQPKSANANGLNGFTVQSSSSANFFENQTDGDSGMVGSVYDTIRKVDRDNWKVLAFRQHKIGWAGTLNTTNAVSSFNNNDFKQYATGRIKIKGYNLKFDRLDRPQNVPIYMFVQTMAADGSTYTTSQIPVDFKFNSAIYFSDM